MNSQILVLLVCLPFCLSEYMELARDEEGPPQPYTFGYEVHDKDGEQWRSEVSDGFGHVHGSYGFVDTGGMHRAVEYVADDAGFRARIRTNEPGMDIPNPADVEMVAEPPSDYDASVYGMENVHLPLVANPVVRSNMGRKGKKFYKYHKFAEKSVPPIYVVDGHLQSPWFPMHTVAHV